MRTGTETFFRDLRSPDTRSSSVFAFHKPNTLKEWLGRGLINQTLTENGVKMVLKKLNDVMMGEI